MTHVFLCDETGAYLFVEDPTPIQELKNDILHGTWSPSIPLPSTRINATARGELLIVVPDASPGRKPVTVVPRITARELQVLEGLTEGQSYKQMAAKYQISPRTVRDRVDRLKIKLNANSPIQVVAKAVALGLIKPRLE